tara:strand:- start:76 stop:294 length:219 start_codon:yes stop_codon:yes gene_type:complete
MAAGNLNQGAAYIMGSDKVSVNDAQGSDKLYREGLEFTTDAKTDVLTQDMPKKQTKATVEASLFSMAEQRDY